MIVLSVALVGTTAARADLELLRCTAQASGNTARLTMPFDMDRKLFGDLKVEVEKRTGGDGISAEFQGFKLTKLKDGGVALRVGSRPRTEQLWLQLSASNSEPPKFAFSYSPVFEYNAMGDDPGVVICSRKNIQNSKPEQRTKCLESPNECLELD